MSVELTIVLMAYNTGLPPTLYRRESVMEISSRGQTRVRKWGERKDARSLSGAGWGVTFQGRDPSAAS